MIKKNFIKYSAYIISYLSLAGYFLSYKYKEGYYYYFNIPNVYINGIDFIDIIKMISALILFFSGGLYIMLTHRPKDKERDETWISRIDQIVMPISIVLLLAGIIDVKLIKVLLLFVIVIILLYNFIFPLIVHHNENGYNNKIAAFFKSESDMSFIEILEHKMKYQTFSLIIMVVFSTFLLGVFVNFLGHQNAKNKETFDVTIIDGVKHVLFNVNEESVVASSINNKVLSKNYSMLSKNNLMIKKENIKDLKVNK